MTNDTPKNKHYLLATVQQKKYAKELCNEKVKEKGIYIYKSCNGLLALRWKDKRDVYMLSIKYKTIELIKVMDKLSKKHGNPTM